MCQPVEAATVRSLPSQGRKKPYGTEALSRIALSTVCALRAFKLYNHCVIIN